jgi:cytochrome P450
MGAVDETAESFWADPHPVLAAARERAALATTPIALYDVLRYDDVQRLLKDPRLGQVGLELIASQGITSGPLYDWWQLIMFNNDPPIHTRLRSLVGRAFTPRRVRDFRERIRQVAETCSIAARRAGGGSSISSTTSPTCFRPRSSVRCSGSRRRTTTASPTGRP